MSVAINTRLCVKYSNGEVNNTKTLPEFALFTTEEDVQLQLNCNCARSGTKERKALLSKQAVKMTALT